MILKIIGIALILFATTVYAANRIALQRSRLLATRDMRDVCKHIADSISFSLEPLPDILAKLAKEDLGEVGDFLEDLCSQLASEENHSLKQVWQGTLLAHQKRLNFSPKTLHILKNLGDKLGTMYHEIEIENIHYTVEALEEEWKREEQSYLQNAKLLRSFGVLVGIFIVILFL